MTIEVTAVDHIHWHELTEFENPVQKAGLA
jgi:hypothetical protein